MTPTDHIDTDHIEFIGDGAKETFDHLVYQIAKMEGVPDAVRQIVANVPGTETVVLLQANRGEPAKFCVNYRDDWEVISTFDPTN